MSAKLMGWVLQQAPHAPECECESCHTHREEGKTPPRAAKNGEPALRSDKEIVMCLVLADMANKKSGHAVWASMETIAERCRCSSRHARRILATLAERGLIDRKFRNGTTTVYRVLTPDVAVSGVTPDICDTDPGQSCVRGPPTSGARTPDKAMSAKP